MIIIIGLVILVAAVVTGSRRLRADQATGNIKQAGAKIKDASGR
jgi:hypothetical protein